MHKSNPDTKTTLAHWRKLVNSEKTTPAIGAGVHQQITATPYLFTRTLTKGDFTDKVLIGLDLPIGKKQLDVSAVLQMGLN
jgi:alpha-amylase